MSNAKVTGDCTDSSLLCRVKRHKWEMKKQKQQGQTHPFKKFAKGKTEKE